MQFLHSGSEFGLNSAVLTSLPFVYLQRLYPEHLPKLSISMHCSQLVAAYNFKFQKSKMSDCNLQPALLIPFVFTDTMIQINFKKLFLNCFSPLTKYFCFTGPVIKCLTQKHTPLEISVFTLL